MKDSLKPGLTHELTFTVNENKTVPKLYPEAERFQDMPAVFATGFMVGLLEWCCLECMIPHLDWPDEQSVGTRVNFTHEAATLPGQTVTVTCTVTEVDGRRVAFTAEAHDGIDLISRGEHERFVITKERFDEGLAKKREAIG